MNVWFSSKRIGCLASFHRAMIPYRNADGSRSFIVGTRAVKGRSDSHDDCVSNIVADTVYQLFACNSLGTPRLTQKPLHRRSRPMPQHSQARNQKH